MADDKDKIYERLEAIGLKIADLEFELPKALEVLQTGRSQEIYGCSNQELDAWISRTEGRLAKLNTAIEKHLKEI